MFTKEYTELAAELHRLHNVKRHVPSIGGQQLGLEQYRIVASGQTWEVLIEAADALLRLSESQSRWINTDERTPDNEQTVLGYWVACVGRDAVFESVKYFAKDAPDSGEAWQSAFGEDTDRPDYWQPLPRSPK